MNVKSYIKKSLVNFGLTEGEVIVYMAMLDTLGIEVSDIRSKTRLSNAGVYKIIDSLISKGFVEMAADVYPARFFAVPLEKIAGKFAIEGRKMGRIADRFKNLSRLNKQEEVAEVLEDEELTTLYLDIPYKMDDFIWCVGSFGACKSFVGVDTEKLFIKTRAKRGVQCDALIFDDNEDSRKIAGTDKLEKRETKFVSGYNYPMEFSCLYNDTVLTFYKDFDDKIKVLKTDAPELARAKLLQYQTLWKAV